MGMTRATNTVLVAAACFPSLSVLLHPLHYPPRIEAADR